jgi:hypothetical protein
MQQGNGRGKCEEARNAENIVMCDINQVRIVRALYARSCHYAESKYASLVSDHNFRSVVPEVPHATYMIHP